VLIKVRVHPCPDLNFAGSRQKKPASGEEEARLKREKGDKMIALTIRARIK
jgi:hypothetical protein